VILGEGPDPVEVVTGPAIIPALKRMGHRGHIQAGLGLVALEAAVVLPPLVILGKGNQSVTGVALQAILQSRGSVGHGGNALQERHAVHRDAGQTNEKK